MKESGSKESERGDRRVTHFRGEREKAERGSREGERLLCFFLEEEGILRWGVMSTTASIYTSHLHGNDTHSFQNRADLGLEEEGYPVCLNGDEADKW